ncbi:hypothetical protein [Flagellimonas onchidii]|uniref:hypothetical protein n=1 Tax=Flagellimonas onchidii TaxID=2562684 RepID=UPI0010A648D7|nr:hypothetical protein [Allomuricauda onchidii]
MPSLGVNQVFTAGDFPVTVKSVTDHGGGRYSGWGLINITYLGDANVRVTFNNIKINTDHQMVAGLVVASYDADGNGIVDVDDTIDAVIGGIKNLFNDLFSQKEDLLDQLSETQSVEEQQNIISKINDVEVTIAQQIDNIPGKEHLPQELQQELQDLKQEAGIAGTGQLSLQEIEDIKIADAERRERINEIATIVENHAFVEIGAQILNDPEKSIPFWQTIEKLERVYDFLQQCNNEHWTSYQAKGVVPHCLWRDAEVAGEHLYSVSDLPYLSGLVDGAYIEGKEILKLPQLLKDLGNGIQQLIYSFTVAYIECNPKAVKANQDRLTKLLETIEVAEERKELLDWMKEQLDKFVLDDKERKEKLEQYLDQCKRYDETRQAVEDFYDFIADWKEVKRLYGQVSEKLVETLKVYRYYSFVNEDRYQRALLDLQIFSVATGLGAVTKIKKVKDILLALRNFTQKQWDDLGRKYGDEISNVGTDLLKKADDAFLQAKNQTKVWSGYDCSEIAEDIFEAVGEGKIIRVEGKNGNWIKVKQLGFVDEFQYHEIYVYKEKVYDVRFDDYPVRYDDFIQHINEVNSIDVKITIIRQ